MASRIYNPGLLKLQDGTIDFISDTIHIIIVSASYTFVKSHEFIDDLTNEVTNTGVGGYSRKTLAGKAITLDSGNDRVFYDGTNPQYDPINTNEDLAAAILAKDVTNDADSPLIAMIDFPDLPTNGSNVTLEINSGGLFRINNTSLA